MEAVKYRLLYNMYYSLSVAICGQLTIITKIIQIG